jgi:flavocytochrome c
MKMDKIDVIVIGGGSAGMVASMTAADEGAKVLLIEKTDVLGGTMYLSGGSSVGAATKMQFEAGILDDSPSRFYAECMQEEYARKVCNPDILWYYCQNTGPAVDWLDSLGAYPAEFRGPRASIYGEPWTVKRAYFTEENILGGDKYLKVFASELDKRIKRGDVEVLFNTSATEFIMKNGKIAGVKAKDADGAVKEYSAPAIILSTGGFTSNLDLVRKYKWPETGGISSVGWHGCTGDGLIMCEKIGVKLANMDQEMAPYPGGVPDPHNPGRQLTAANMDAYPGAIWVDINGKRRNREDAGMRMIETRLAIQDAPEMTVFVILDQKIRDENPSIFFNMFDAGKTWEEFDKMANEGVLVKKADTLEELATTLGINALNFKESIERYNGFVAAGKDEDFGRQELKYKIENPPFYGIRTVPVVVMSNGGPATNDRMQVLDENDKIIPGLYAAGEITGYRGFGTGSGNMGCVVFGKRAGTLAAQYAMFLSK